MHLYFENSSAEHKVFSDTWDGSWDIPMSGYPDIPGNDPSLARSAWTWRIQWLWRPFWSRQISNSFGPSGSAMHRMRFLATLQQGNWLRKLTISAISEIQCQSELSEVTGPIRATLPSNQAESSIKRGCFTITKVSCACRQHDHSNHGLHPELQPLGIRCIENLFDRFKNLKKKNILFKGLLIVLTFQTEGDPKSFQGGRNCTLNLVPGVLGMSKNAPANFIFLAAEDCHRSGFSHVWMQSNKPCDFPSLKRDLRIPQTGTWSIWWHRIAACRDGKRQKAKTLWIGRGRPAVRWWTTKKFKPGLRGDAAEFKWNWNISHAEASS